MTFKIFIPLLLTLALFSGCEKKEKLYPPPVWPAGTQTQTFGMGENYENQIWFEFSTQKTEFNRHDVWDIAFAAGESHQIYVNGGKNAFFGVAKFPGSDFNSFQVIDIKNTKWEFDNPDGGTDSLVFTNWCNYNGNGKFSGKDILYVIDLGDDTLGIKRYVKLKVLGREGGNYHIQWSNLQDTIPVNDVYLTTNEKYNLIYYNFALKKEVYNEPMEKLNWDIVFTTYKKSLPEGNGTYIPYVLRGVLSNSPKVKVAEVTGIFSYEDIKLSHAQSALFSDAADEIGYDWKIWNLSANKYTVDQKKVFIIQDTKGDLYKMKFVDFYDDMGRKGFPKMAWELLK